MILIIPRLELAFTIAWATGYSAVIANATPLLTLSLAVANVSTGSICVTPNLDTNVSIQESVTVEI